jgi:hypothetical protein
MRWTRRASVLAATAVIVVLGLAVPSPAGALAAPAGDLAVTTVPRPPFDPGVGDAITRTVFTTPDGSASCRRVYTEMIWLECLLVRTNEVVRFGPDESWIDVACISPHQSETCRLGFGSVQIRPATRAAAARFAGARRVPLERLIELGRRMVPYPVCIADPNLGLSCSTMMDDSVGEQIYLGLAGSVWNCPGYEFIDAETAIPRGHDRCRVIRP